MDHYEYYLTYERSAAPTVCDFCGAAPAVDSILDHESGETWYLCDPCIEEL